MLWHRGQRCCVWCGLVFGALSDKRLTIEHLVPIAFGGSNARDNTILACANCNRKRGKWYLQQLGHRLQLFRNLRRHEHALGGDAAQRRIRRAIRGT